jgi:hypothetical protein
LERYARSLRIPNSAALPSLAEALANNPDWPTGLTLVVRRDFRPLIGVLGLVPPERQAWLRAQVAVLDPNCRTLRYLDFRRVVDLTCQLAALLEQELGTEQLLRARFLAIPRGGLVVLGLLASLLHVPHAQLEPLDSSEEDLQIVIDDCALSGARFGRFLSSCPARRIVFAPLCSTPELRQAILRRESRVVACLSALDLSHTPLAAALPQDPAGDPEQEFRYWKGQTEPLCFPWNEPDRSIWNPLLGRYQAAWRIAPPGRCLKNRPIPGAPTPTVQIQPLGQGPLRPSGHVLFGEVAGELVLCDFKSGECSRLTGSGADLWHAVVQHGKLESIVMALSACYDVPEQELRRDVSRFVEDLLARGLLEQ